MRLRQGLQPSRQWSFNSRTPGGVRLKLTTSRSTTSMFQFTHPGRGATTTSRSSYPHFAGFNSRTPGGVRRQTTYRLRFGRCFNSRTPGGVRHAPSLYDSRFRLFQFTHPGRGATSSTSALGLGRTLFQFTHPGRGATRVGRRSSPFARSFNSRTPGGVRRIF